MDWSEALREAEREMWDDAVSGLPTVADEGIVYDDEPPAPEPTLDGVECDGCDGSGIYYGAGSVVNGVFKGFTGKCYRCGGKGRQTESDVKRNRYYDNRVRRFSVG